MIFRSSTSSALCSVFFFVITTLLVLTFFSVLSLAESDQEPKLNKHHNLSNSLDLNRLKHLQNTHVNHHLKGIHRRPLHFNSFQIEKSDDATIFVAVAAFRDVECLITLDWMYFRASNPRRVFAGIIEQNEHGDPTCVPDHFYNCMSADFCPLDNIRRRTVPSKSGRGPCYGRYISMLMYRGEHFYMLIDSHNVWTKHWDRKSIVQLYRARSSRPIISHYPNIWEKQLDIWTAGGAQHVSAVWTGKHPPDSEALNRKGLPYEMNGNLMVMCNGHYLPSLGFIRMDSSWFERQIEPWVQPFSAAGFLFSDSLFLKSVPFDPYLDYLFDGEEILFSVRAWTHGFDLFTPGESVLFHDYARHNAKRYWHTPGSQWGLLIVHAQKRVQYFLKVKKMNSTEYLIDRNTKDPKIVREAEKYGPGKERTVEEFEQFAKINNKMRKAGHEFCNMLVSKHGKPRSGK